MLRYIAFGIIVTSLIIGAQLFRASEQKGAPTDAQSRQPSTADNAQLTPNQTQVDLSSTRELVSEGTQGASPGDEETVGVQEQAIAQTRSIKRQSAWEEDLEDPIAPARFSNKGIPARALKLNRDQLKEATRGSELSLPIPQTGRDYTMSVTQVGQHQNGDKTLKGHLKGNTQYAVVMTQGARATFATVNTPDGSFLLEANENQGWILATTDLNGLIDPNLVDYMIPEISR